MWGSDQRSLNHSADLRCAFVAIPKCGFLTNSGLLGLNAIPPCLPGDLCPSLPLSFVFSWLMKEAGVNLASPLRKGQRKPLRSMWPALGGSVVRVGGKLSRCWSLLVPGHTMWTGEDLGQMT